MTTMTYWTDLTTDADGALHLIDATDAYVDPEGVTYLADWHKSTIPGLVPVTMADRPDETPTAYTLSGEPRGGVIVTGWRVELIDGTPTQVWETEARPALSADEAAALRPGQIAARRWAAETGGIVWQGWPVATDRESQAKISAAYALARDGLWPDGGGWKGADGLWHPLGADQIIALSLAVAAHVQACFSHEAALLADPADDIETGWPGAAG